jgi:putative membrane protein
LKTSLSGVIFVAIKGFAMGCADIVPGVSGGTVALITGIYYELLNTIQKIVKSLILLVKLRFIDFFLSINLIFLIPLGVGLITAGLTMAKVIKHTMKVYPEYTWGAFLGMMIASIIIVIKLVEKWKIFFVSLVILSSMLAYLITTQTSYETEASPENFFFAGFVAIIAMILPGISGSFLLIIMGKYEQILAALEGLSRGEVANFLHVAIPFGCGCAIGISVFSWILKMLLKHYRDMTFAILIGLMIGSLHKLWPFRYVIQYRVNSKGEQKTLLDGMDYVDFSNPVTLQAFIFVAIGFFTVLIIDRFSRKTKEV